MTVSREEFDSQEALSNRTAKATIRAREPTKGGHNIWFVTHFRFLHFLLKEGGGELLPPPRLFPDCSVRDCGHPATPHIPRTGLSTSFTPDHRRSGLHTRMRLILFPVCPPHILRLTFFALLLFIMRLFRRQIKYAFLF